MQTQVPEARPIPASPPTEALLGGAAQLAARELMRLDLTFRPVPIYETHVGTRMNFVVDHGRATGPGIEAEVLPGSADWLLIGADRIARVDVRATLLTDDGAHIYLTNTGRVRLGEHTDRFLAGEVVPADDAYIRTVPLFETTAERYAFLNGSVNVAYCDISTTSIAYRIYTLD